MRSMAREIKLIEQVLRRKKRWEKYRNNIRENM